MPQAFAAKEMQAGRVQMACALRLGYPLRHQDECFPKLSGVELGTHQDDLAFLTLWVSPRRGKRAGDKQFPFSCADLLGCVFQLIAEFKLEGLHIRPRSLRRGGATHHIQTFGSLDRTMLLSRWGSIKTTRLYLNQDGRRR
eukprot:704873-Amphidinium_carterae.1